MLATNSVQTAALIVVSLTLSRAGIPIMDLNGRPRLICLDTWCIITLWL